MGAAAGAVIGGISLVMGAMGQSAAANADAAKSERAKEVAFVQADQLDSQSRDALNTTIANIKSIRASTNADPDSPTSQAYIDTERAASDRVRTIKVGAARMQGNQYGLDAATYRTSAKYALLGGALSAGAKFADAIPIMA